MKKILISESELVGIIKKIIIEESSTDPGDIIKAIQKIFGVTGKSAEKLFNSLVKTDTLSDITRTLNQITPKNVDELVTLIKSSPKFADELAEKIFSNTNLRNEFDNEIIEKLSSMDIGYIKKLEQIVKKNDVALLFHTKKLIKNTTTISDTLLDGLIKSFKKKHGLINVSEPLITNLEKKTTQIPLDPPTVKEKIPSVDYTKFEPILPKLKIPEIKPTMGLPGMPEPEFQIVGAREGYDAIIDVSNGVTKYYEPKPYSQPIKKMPDCRYKKNQTFTRPEDGQTRVQINYSTDQTGNGTRPHVTPAGNHLSDNVGRPSGLGFTFVAPENYAKNEKFIEKVRNKFLEELDIQIQNLNMRYNTDLSLIPQSSWEIISDKMKEFLKSPH